MRSFSTLRAPSTLATCGRSVTEALAVVAPEWIGDKHPDFLAEPSDDECVRQRSGIESENQQARVLSFAIFFGCDTSDVDHAISLQIRHDLILGHVSEFRSENDSLGSVATLVQRHRHLLSAELSGLQESFRVCAFVRLQDKCTVGGRLDFDFASAADRIDLFLRPENVDFAERDTLLTGFYN